MTSWKDTVKVNKGLLSSWTNQMNMKTINESYAGKSLNGVPYREKTILLYGKRVTGVFPVFEGIKVVLDGSVDALYKQLGNTDYAFYHGTMRLATIKLKEMLERNAALKKQFTKEPLDDIQAGREKVSGKIWHHYEELDGDCPIMQLVDEELHGKCNHTGGSYTWNPKHLE